MRNAGTRDRIMGSLGSRDGKDVVRIEDSLDAGIQRVWRGLRDASARFGELFPLYRALPGAGRDD